MLYETLFSNEELYNEKIYFDNYGNNYASFYAYSMFFQQNRK